MIRNSEHFPGKKYPDHKPNDLDLSAGKESDGKSEKGVGRGRKGWSRLRSGHVTVSLSLSAREWLAERLPDYYDNVSINNVTDRISNEGFSLPSRCMEDRFYGPTAEDVRGKYLSFSKNFYDLLYHAIKNPQGADVGSSPGALLESSAERATEWQRKES